MKFQIEYSAEAFKQLKKLDRVMLVQIVKRLEKLSENPLLAKPLSNEFKNFLSEHVGKYRIVFSIRDEKITIAKIERRKTVYR